MHVLPPTPTNPPSANPHLLPLFLPPFLPASCKCCIFGLFFSAVKGCQCQSSQIASAPPLSARMSPTVAESGGSNYPHSAAWSASEFVCVCALVHTFRHTQQRMEKEKHRPNKARKEIWGSFLKISSEDLKSLFIA